MMNDQWKSHSVMDSSQEVLEKVKENERKLNHFNHR